MYDSIPCWYCDNGRGPTGRDPADPNKMQPCPNCGGLKVVPDDDPAEALYTEADYVQLAAIARDVLGWMA